MRIILGLSVIFLCLSACKTVKHTVSQTIYCPPNAPLFTEELGTALINAWGQRAYDYSPDGALGEGDAEIGAAYFTAVNYLPNAVLLPTVSYTTRDSPQTIYDYFTHFLANCPEMTNNPSNAPLPIGPFVTLQGCGYGVISGFYDFNFTCGNIGFANARYTFQFQYIATADTVTIMPYGGHPAVQVVQSPGWYIMLQNSAVRPSTP